MSDSQPEDETVVLRLTDKKCWLGFLKVLAGKKQVTFSIRPDKIWIATLSAPRFFLTIPNALYETTGAKEFTIDIDSLLEYLPAFNEDMILLSDSLRLVRVDDGAGETPEADKENVHENHQKSSITKWPAATTGPLSYIDIPFTMPVRSYYIRQRRVTTRCMVPKTAMKYFLPGTVVYSNERGRLVHRRRGCEIDETVRARVEYLSEEHLCFLCSNDWVQSLNAVHGSISASMFSFAEGLLSVKVLFGEDKNLELEIQVEEKSPPRV